MRSLYIYFALQLIAALLFLAIIYMNLPHAACPRSPHRRELTMFDDRDYHPFWCVLDPETGEKYGNSHLTKRAAIDELSHQRERLLDRPGSPTLNLAHVHADGTITYHEEH